MEIRIDMPDSVKKIINTLCENGYSAYAVGGCIRDSVMGRIPFDWDICTSSLPEETLKALGKPNIIKNGMKHGTVTVRYENTNYEVTTFRTDGEYLDNRHPENVSFVTDIKEDLSRRDFTVNALAYNEKDGIIDHFDGIGDIRKKIIRCVGDPDKRFSEDGLRIMRALRFAAQLGFSVEKNTSDSIHRNAHLLNNISAERLMAELIKLLMGEYAEPVLLEYPDVLSVFIPEIKPMIGFEQKNPHHIYDVWEHTVKVITYIENTKNLRLSALFHDIGKPYAFTLDNKGIGHFKGHPDISERISDRVLKRLKCDNNTIYEVGLLVRLHDTRPPAEPKNVRRLLSKTGIKCFPKLMELKRADAKAQNPELLKDKLEYIDRLEEIYHSELKSNSAFDLKRLVVNGRDIISLGVTDGRMIGSVLNKLLEFVIDGELENNREQLLDMAGRIIKEEH